ncbi:MAG: molybdate transport system ATP-binding protein [Parasphingorhabdus sp.]|jgi:molybdate transport system ATP-binding protein
MSHISLQNLTVQFDEHFCVHDINWSIKQGQHWALCGGNGSGKSALSAVLHGQGEILQGTIAGVPSKVAVVSFEAQAGLIEAERKKDDADLLDVISEGTPVLDLLNETCDNLKLQQALIEAFNFRPLLQQGFRKLSSGETRKLMLIRALTQDSEMLVLDEPFEGLDTESYEYLQQLLGDLSQSRQIILVLNRFDEIPQFASHIAYLDDGRIVHQVACSDTAAVENLSQLMHLKTTDLSIPVADPANRVPALDAVNPLVRMRDLRIAYGETIIFSGLNWCIEAGQHWQVSGPNGSGKTCLLNLITGDHPQCYVNDIFVFGMQRGSGESIWEIKQYLGYVSSALQWEYNVSVSVRNAIISGFYDSIGIYQKYTEIQADIADQWLKLLGMHDRANQPFSQLSFGDQRLVLIARAMVKHPSLLILDEPCLGLDDLNRQLVLALIERICTGSETTVLYVNHRIKDSVSGIQNHLEMKLRA